jgi:hypothetical protein
MATVDIEEEKGTDRRTYTFQQVLKEAPHESPIVVEALKRKRSLLKKLGTALDGIGFRRFHFVGAGECALVMETTEEEKPDRNKQIIRLTYFGNHMGHNYMMDRRPSHPAILQPIHRFTIMEHENAKEGILVEVLPKVKTTGVQREHYKVLETALTGSGIFVWDLNRPGNVGLMSVKGKGVDIPVLIDAGVADTTSLPKDPDVDLGLWLAPDGTWLQKIFEPRTAPDNVISRTSADKVESALRGPRPLLDRAIGVLGINYDSRRVSQTALAINEDGMHADQLANLYQRAMDEFLKDSNTLLFNKILEQERDKMRKEREGIKDDSISR